MKDYNKIAYCGLFCGACRIYLASTVDRMKELSVETGIPVDLLKCEGCRSSVNCIYCGNCAMKKCCNSKGIFSCAECDEFPCSVLKAFENDRHPHHKSVIDSLMALKEKGKELWLEQQNKRWICNKCETFYSWYDTKCKNCSEPVNGYDKC